MTMDELYEKSELALAFQVRDGKRDLVNVSQIHGPAVADRVAQTLERWDEIQARSDAAEDRLMKMGFFGGAQ